MSAGFTSAENECLVYCHIPGRWCFRFVCSDTILHTNLTSKVKSIRVKSITILRLCRIEPDKGTAGCFFLKP